MIIIKISVIVPVYNSEDTLEKCILSVLNQTLSDIELILINDGSIDKSQEIIDKYKEKYPDKIKTKTIENQGVSNTRNIALDMAEGEYIGFVDGDDYIENTMYEKLYNKAIDENADIVVSGYFVENEKNIRTYQLGGMEQYGKNIKENPNIFVHGVPYVWNKIFKRDIIEKDKIRFSNLRIFEDLEFVYKLYVKANKISKVGEPLYYYVKNSNSVTAQFSDKFLDIIPAIQNLEKYFKDNNCYEEFEDYLIYIALNHIYIRCNMLISTMQYNMKIDFINKVFEFLDTDFPNWKEHEYYFKNTKKNKENYISKSYWKKKTFFQVMKLDGAIKKRKKKFKKITNYNNLGSIYVKYCEKLPINDKLILIDSQHGNDINGNMFYIMQELNNNEEYSSYSVFLGVEPKRMQEFEEKLNFYNLKKVNLVLNRTKEYMKLLATAKYLFSDTSFTPNYIKRDGQIYLNTWHGTPLKTLGRKTKKDFEGIANLQKNFVVADYLLYPSEYMMEHMLEDYMLDNIAKNKILLCGYPRNSIFLNDERRNKVREELNIADKELIAYMPTWRGTLGNKDTDEYIETLKRYLEYLSKNLKENQLLYVNVHPYVKDYIEFDDYENILAFPKQYETYDFLNVCDILITDYSSVFFDFALTKRKIVLFTYDEEKYLNDRGLYESLDNLPFPRVYTVEDLLDEINNKEIVNYSSFLEKFCNYDRVDIPRKICSKIILGQENNLKIINMPQNGKENVLILIRNFSNKEVNKRFFELVNNTNDFKYNYYIGYISRWMRRYSYNLLKLPKEIRYMGQLYSFCNISLKDKVMFRMYNKYGNGVNCDAKTYEKILKNELKRIYNNINFKTIVLLGEEKDLRIKLFSKYDNCFKILYNPDSERANLYSKMYDYIISDEEFEKYNDINEIVKLGEM